MQIRILSGALKYMACIGKIDDSRGCVLVKYNPGRTADRFLKEKIH